MRFKTFTPEIGSGRKEDLEQKLVEKEVVTSVDIKSYADFIINELEKLKTANKNEKQIFIINALSNERILDLVAGKEEYAGLTEEDIEIVAARIRRALAEELKGKINDEAYFIIKDAAAVSFDEKTRKVGEQKENIVSEVVGLHGDRLIYKHQPRSLPEQQKQQKMGLEKFRELPPHANIVNILEYDSESQENLLETLAITPLDAYLERESSSKEKLVASIKVFLDCIKGAEYLAKNHLVLQDIKVSNLGLEIKNKAVKGVLFDLEGLIKEGEKMRVRMVGGTEYLPPEFMVKDVTEIKPAEMVYQFGVSLEKILDYFAGLSTSSIFNRNIINDLKELVIQMKRKNYTKRPTLSLVAFELEKILDLLLK